MSEIAKIIVLRKHNKMSQAVLRTHSNDVATDTVDKPTYAAVSDEADDVKLKSDAYDLACTNAANGGIGLVETKNKRKKELLLALDALGNALQATFTGDYTYIINAHYDYRKNPQQSNEPLPDPDLEFAVNGVLSGTVNGKVSNFPTGVKTVAVEYSDDNGLTWKNGTYSTGKKFTLSGLTPRTDYLIRVFFHGSHQRTSNPSVVKPVFVL
jgi:hypothetical protein